MMATAGWTAIPMWVLGILVFLIPAGLAVVELGQPLARPGRCLHLGLPDDERDCSRSSAVSSPGSR